MGIWSDLLGTSKNFFKIGFSGVRLKNNSGNLQVRNNADSADAEITTSKVNISGDSLVINSDSAGTGADWKITIQRPSSGMSADVTYTLPVDDGTPNQVLSTDGNGVLTWASAASTASSLKMDTTTLNYNSTSPVAMFTTGGADVIDLIEIVIDTPFDGGATASVGISGTTSKYMGTTDMDLSAAAGTVFEIHPGLNAQGAENLILTYSAGSASQGAARILVHYATPA